LWKIGEFSAIRVYQNKESFSVRSPLQARGIAKKSKTRSDIIETGFLLPDLD
jgi:hypothetical protein